MLGTALLSFHLLTVPLCKFKQLAISLLRDPVGTPSGFVGCVRYDYEEIDIHELKDCASELESVYEINEKLINSKINE